MSVSTKETIAIFGYHDSFVGQFLSFSDIASKYNISYFLTTKKLPTLDLQFEHSSRPNKKTEFVQNNMIFGKRVYYDTSFIERLVSDRITKVFVLEENVETREKICTKLQEHKITPLTYVHPSVFLGGDNYIGPGVVIFPNCNIGYKTDIHKGTIIQPLTLICHHNSVCEYCNIAPRVTTGGFTKIGSKAQINLGVNIVNKIKVGSKCVIGAGSLVLKDCEPNSVYVGSPASFLRYNEHSS